MYNYKFKDFISLFSWIFGLLTVGYLIGYTTNNSIEVWYEALNRSSLTPPNAAFGIVWSILYVLIAIVGWKIWSNKDKTKRYTKSLYITQLVLNWLWSPLFFTFHQVELALLCILALTITVSMLIINNIQSKIIAYFLTPYLLWLTFAGYLNLYIIMNN
jgi:tryptophan-rich sensory protein